MFNITVLKMNDIIKYFIGIVLTAFIVVIISRYFPKEKNEGKIVQEVKKEVSILSESSFLECLDKTIPVLANVNEEYRNVANEKDVSEDENVLEMILKTQIGSIKGVELAEEENEQEVKQSSTSYEEVSEDEQDKTQSIEVAKTGMQTEVITDNPIKETYNVEYEKVKIKNQTSYDLTEEMLTPDITIENKNIILFHTHSCESYTSSEEYPYTPTGTFRTTDLNFTVTRVGGELENQLKQYGYNVIHNTDYHDYPAYNGSYTRSLATVENILKETPSDIIIDVHRDAVGSRSDYAPIVKIGDTDVAAQIMFVIGTNGGGLWHPNWNQNLKFAIKVQEKAEEMYPRTI